MLKVCTEAISDNSNQVKSCVSDVKVTDNQSVSLKKNYYRYLSRRRNPDYESGLIPLQSKFISTEGSLTDGLPLRACLLHDKSAVFQSHFWVKKQPKWFTSLWHDAYDPDTGEVFQSGVYLTNEMRASNGTKIKALNKFTGLFQPLYEQYKVSLWFMTLTVANHAKNDISGVLAAFKKRLKRRGITMRGYLWTYEIGEATNKLHWHYHVIIATDRMNVRGGIPDYMKLDDLWGAFTKIELVRKNVRYYMSKYMAKNYYRVLDGYNGKSIRSYGMSMPKQPSS